MDIEDEEPWLRATIKRLRKAIPLVGANHSHAYSPPVPGRRRMLEHKGLVADAFIAIGV